MGSHHRCQQVQPLSNRHLTGSAVRPINRNYFYLFSSNRLRMHSNNCHWSATCCCLEWRLKRTQMGCWLQEPHSCGLINDTGTGNINMVLTSSTYLLFVMACLLERQSESFVNKQWTTELSHCDGITATHFSLNNNNVLCRRFTIAEFNTMFGW